MTAKNTTPLEAFEQEQVIRWARANAVRRPELRLLHASLSGAKLSARVRVAMKRQGMEAGVPDLSLDVARGIFHGLRIEMKRRKGGRVSPAQKRFHELLRNEGYAVHVARGWQEGVKVIEEYLDLPGPCSWPS